MTSSLRAHHERRLREPKLGDGNYFHTVYFDRTKPGRFLDDIKAWVKRFVSHGRTEALLVHAYGDIQAIWDQLSSRSGNHIPRPETGALPINRLLVPLASGTADGEPVRLRIHFAFGWQRAGQPFVRAIQFSMSDSIENIRTAELDQTWERLNKQVLGRARNRRPTAQERYFPDSEWSFFPREWFIGSGEHGRGRPGYDKLQQVLQGIYPLARHAAQRHTNHFLPSSTSKLPATAGGAAGKLLYDIGKNAKDNLKAPMGSIGKSLVGNAGKTAVGSGIPLIKAGLDIAKGNYASASANTLTAIAAYAFEGNPATGLITSVAGMFEEGLHLGESGRVQERRLKIYLPFAVGFASRFASHMSWSSDPVAHAITEYGEMVANNLTKDDQIAIQVLLLYRVSRDSGWKFASAPTWTFPDDYKRNWSPESLIRGMMLFFGDEPYRTH